MSAEHDTAVSDEDIARAIAYYRQTPTRVWGSRMVSMLTELQSRRSRVENARDEVLEAAAKVADGLDGCGGGYGDYPSGWDHACGHVAETIRSLKDKP